MLAAASSYGHQLYRRVRTVLGDPCIEAKPRRWRGKSEFGHLHLGIEDCRSSSAQLTKKETTSLQQVIKCQKLISAPRRRILGLKSHETLSV